MSVNSTGFRLRLPATSANLGSGFDAVAIALDFYLEIEAQRAHEFSIEATGRDAERCAQIEDNLILDIYRRVLSEHNKPEMPLALRMSNDIPLGMGCGSSAAGRLAAIALAVRFGDLGWGSERILEEASALEGHPDNAAACWMGGFVATACEGKTVHVARVTPPSKWRAILALPETPLATSKARAVLPDAYSRSDVVSNLQAVSMLGLAFAQGRGDLLRVAMNDKIHQPYRAPICTLLERLLPLAGHRGVLGVALSGAGPAVLLVLDEEKSIEPVAQLIREASQGLVQPEILACGFYPAGAKSFLESTPTGLNS
ncbi:MAG: homoserine kinase [Terracidiphilus sp.]